MEELTASARVRDRLRALNVPFFANDGIADHLQPGELEAIEAEVAGHVRAMLAALVIDFEHDHNTAETARRVAKMYVREIFAGRYTTRPPVTDFPNAKKLDQLYTVGPITIRSACSHHLCPIEGQAWCGVIPGERVIGLSKFNRLADWVLSRPQIQEEAVVQLADEIEELIKPRGLGVVIKAKHTCMTWRGVRESGDAAMTTSVMRGILREAPAAREEFLTFVRGHGFECR